MPGIYGINIFDNAVRDLLGLCAKIHIKTIKMKLERSKGFMRGYCNGWAIWDPRLNVGTQEDEASLISLQLYNKFLLPLACPQKGGDAYGAKLR